MEKIQIGISILIIAVIGRAKLLFKKENDMSYLTSSDIHLSV